MSRPTPKPLTIRITEPTRAIVSAASDVELSDELKLRLIAWLVSDVVRRLDVREVELAYDSDEDERC
jgi:hypothetical protein